MKQYYHILKDNTILEHDGETITVYSKNCLGIRYIPKVNHWSGTQESLIRKIKSEMKIDNSTLIGILYEE